MYSKTLGTENARLLTMLAGKGKMVFSIEEARNVGGKDYSATLHQLYRLTKAGWLVKINAGKYAVVPLSAGQDALPEVNRLVIARELIGNAPYFVSHDSAFEVHNMLTRPVTSVTVTSSRRLQARTILKVPYYFVAAKPKDMWGYAMFWVSSAEQVQVSDLERTILDGLARPELCGGISEVATGLLIRKNDLNCEKLVNYARQLGNQAVAKRLGYLLEFYGLGTPQVFASLHELIGPSYALLDPVLPPDGRFVARWRLRLNIDADILKAVALT